MKEWTKKSAVLLIIILIGIMAALTVLLHRAGIEKDAMTYDLVADYSDFREMANQSDISMADWLKLLADNGVTKVGLYETNASALSDAPGEGVSVRLEKDITEESDWKETYPAELTALIEESVHYTDALITVRDLDTFNWMVDAYNERAEKIKMETVVGDGVYYIWIYGQGGGLSGEEWAEFPLGLWPAQVKMVEDAGCSVIPRTTTKKGQNGIKFAGSVLEEFAEYDSPYFMNSGDGILGFDDEKKGPELLADYLDKTDAAFIVTEQMNEQGNVNWDGDKAFLEKINYKSIRAFNEWSYIQCRYKYYNYDGPQEISNSLFRAIYERNCCIVYFKAILAKKMKTDEKVGTYITDPDEYVRLIKDLDDHMERCGYTNQTAVAVEAYQPPLLLKFLIGAGCAAAAVLLLDLFYALSTKQRYALLAVLLIGVAGALAVMPNTGKILLSIGGGAIMPCLAAAGLIRYMRYTSEKNGAVLSSFAILGQALAGTVILGIVCFFSSMFTAAALSESEYMLEVSLYRGVKLMQLVPLMIFFLSFLQVYIVEQYAFGWELPRIGAGGDPSAGMIRRKRWNAFLDRPIRYREIFYLFILFGVVGIIGLMGLYYIIRTGNMDNEVISSKELEIRNFLENTLPARPRTKEFLIGYPCMMLMIWSFRRNIPALPFFFGCMAVIGMTSIVNTFLHIRTPLSLSFIRVLTGLGFGLVIGLAAVVFFELVYRFARKRWGAVKPEEV